MMPPDAGLGRPPTDGEPFERGHRVSVIEEERVTDRGTSSQLWFVQFPQGWVRVGAVPAAVAADMAPAPRTVWSRRWELVLKRGTVLMRRDTRPFEGARHEPLDLLLRGPVRREQVVRSYYRVGPRGELMPEAGRS